MTTGTSSSAAAVVVVTPQRSHHDEEKNDTNKDAPISSSDDLPKLNTTPPPPPPPPKSESRDEEDNITSSAASKSRGGGGRSRVKQMLFSKKLSSTKKLSSSSSFRTSPQLSKASSSSSLLLSPAKEEQMTAAFLLSSHHSTEVDEMDQYKHSSAAGEHFARLKKSSEQQQQQGEQYTPFRDALSRMASSLIGQQDRVAEVVPPQQQQQQRRPHSMATAAAGGEQHFFVARNKSEEGGGGGGGSSSSPLLRGVIHRMTPSFMHLGGNTNNLSSSEDYFDNNEEEDGNNDDEVVVGGGKDERFKHLSSAGEHFARIKAEKKAEKAAAAAAKKKVKKTKARNEEANTATSTTAANDDHSVNSDDDDNENCKEIDEVDDDHDHHHRYRHMSAAGEHFARKKSDGVGGESSTSLFSRMTSSRLTGGQCSTTAVSNEGSEDEEEVDRYKHLSSAGEHFARKKAEKKAEKAANKARKVEAAAAAAATTTTTTSAVAADHSVFDDKVSSEIDRNKHLSAAGEHFARKKAEEKKNSSKFWDMPKKKNAFHREDDGDGTPFPYLSPAGKQFETTTVQKDEDMIASPNNKKTEASVGEDKETKEEEHLLDSRNVSARSYNMNVVSSVDSEEEVPGMFVQQLLTSDTSTYEQECDDCAADSLDQAFDVVLQKMEENDRETTLTTEEDGRTLGEAENEKEQLVINSDASIAAAQSQLDIIQRMPAYTLHRHLVIGKGSYGQVYIASRGEAEGHFSSKPGKRKKFACKCVSLPADPKYICKLQEEVNVLRVLRGHVNVIRLYDVFVIDNELLIITELGTGGDLFHLLATHPKHGLSEEYAAKTVSDMLSAVAILHSLHICHRDLKIENWVLKSGNDLWSPLKLIDFGLSTHFTPGHKLSRVVGSSYYIAPEVLKKSYTEACDLWSLGVIVYMLLSGAPPFFGSSEEAIKASILSGVYSFPQELFGDVSEEAMAFVSCLLSYDEDKRYTAQQALNHPWLEAKCQPEQLLRCKAGAKP